MAYQQPQPPGQGQSSSQYQQLLLQNIAPQTPTPQFVHPAQLELSSSSFEQPASPPSANAPILMRQLFDLCQLAISGINTYLGLVDVSAIAEDTGDEFHPMYWTYMQNTMDMLQHVQCRIEAISAAARQEWDVQYGTIPSYSSLMAWGGSLPKLLGQMKGHHDLIGSIGVAAAKPTSRDFGYIREEFRSMDTKWRTCLEDVNFTLANSAMENAVRADSAMANSAIS